MSRKLLAPLLLSVFALGACANETTLEPAANVVTQSLSSDPDVVAVGKAIFFDERLSVNGNQSCAACHNPAWGWTGPLASINAAGAVYEGSIPGAFGDRKPPSSAYATQSPPFHFDGELFIGGNFWDGPYPSDIFTRRQYFATRLVDSQRPNVDQNPPRH